MWAGRQAAVELRGLKEMREPYGRNQPLTKARKLGMSVDGKRRAAMFHTAKRATRKKKQVRDSEQGEATLQA